KEQHNSMTMFSELPICAYLQERLSSQKFINPTPVQAATIPPALEGKDILATAQTGTGKTLAFLLPIMQRLLAQESDGVAAMVLAEADRMLDMGFIDAIRRIVAPLPKQRQTMLFSATLDASVAHLVHDYLRHPLRVELGSVSRPVSSVKLQAFEVANDQKLALLEWLLASESGRTLVFARTKRGTERLAQKLQRGGWAASMIHGNRSQSQRTAALTDFQRGRTRLLIATDVASRGIHVDDIAHVINYDLPQVAEDFIHRVGRTGRAGAEGKASTFFSHQDRHELSQLERTLSIRMERMQISDDLAREERVKAMYTSADP